MPLYTLQNEQSKQLLGILFIHVPKCGGTTVERVFEQCGFHSFLAPRDYALVRGFLKTPPAHFDISMLGRMFRLDKIYSFAVVRNPYDRMLSDYHWARERSTSEDRFRKMGFEEFIEDCFRNYAIDDSYLAGHIVPQSKFVSSNVSRTFHLEAGLDNAFNQVFSDVGLSVSGTLKIPELNASSAPGFKLTQRAKDLIYEFYEEDFRTFGYAR